MKPKEILLKFLRTKEFTPGYLNESDIYLRELGRLKGSSEVWKAILGVYWAENNNPYIMTQLLHAISHLDYREDLPIGIFLLVKTLSHQKFIDVQEAAIGCFETWGDMNDIMNRECIGALRAMDIRIAWIADYRDQVIIDLTDF